MITAYRFRTSARSVTVFAIVAVVWAALAAAWFWLDAALWIVALLGAFTLPALYDLIADPEAGLVLENGTLSWFSGRRSVTLSLDEIDHVRLDTRLDFSVRAAAVLRTGRKVRLPFESTPPHRAFETALQAHGIKVERHHFELFQ